MQELTKKELEFVQVIEELDNGDVRVYNVQSMHRGDNDDPLTTIQVKGYEDHKTVLSEEK
jgi:hypothetical protein